MPASMRSRFAWAMRAASVWRGDGDQRQPVAPRRHLVTPELVDHSLFQPRFRVGGVERERLVGIGLGRVEIVEAAMGAGAEHVGIHQVGIHRHGRVEVGDGPLIAPQVELCLRPVHQQRRVVRCQGDRARQGGGGLIGVPAHQPRLPRVAQQRGADPGRAVAFWARASKRAAASAKRSRPMSAAAAQWPAASPPPASIHAFAVSIACCGSLSARAMHRAYREAPSGSAALSGEKTRSVASTQTARPETVTSGRRGSTLVIDPYPTRLYEARGAGGGVHRFFCKTIPRTVEFGSPR